MKWPNVLSEHDTLLQVVSGRSLARYGDGEFKMACGNGIKSQRHHPVLQQRLRDILSASGDCLVGIPNINSKTPKVDFWSKQKRFAPLLANRPYVSSFVTRPDSAPWINEPGYWAMLESLWVGQDVTLVRGSTKSLTADDLVGARTVTEILSPRQHAFEAYGELMERIGTPTRALLCVGPTATVMAVDLCKKGVHAIDLGHGGMFLRKRRRGEPMWVTEEDRKATA